MDSANAVVEEDNAATVKMASSSSEVTAAIERNAAVMGQVAAAMQTVSAQAVQVTDATGTLADMAQELHALVGQSRLEAEACRNPNGDSPRLLHPHLAARPR